MSSNQTVKPVSVTINGATYRGSYFVEKKIVHLDSTFGQKAAELGGSSPETIAKLLLSEVVHGLQDNPTRRDHPTG
jgi:hypothetical protein